MRIAMILVVMLWTVSASGQSISNTINVGKAFPQWMVANQLIINSENALEAQFNYAVNLSNNKQLLLGNPLGISQMLVEFDKIEASEMEFIQAVNNLMTLANQTELSQQDRMLFNLYIKNLEDLYSAYKVCFDKLENVLHFLQDNRSNWSFRNNTIEYYDNGLLQKHKNYYYQFEIAMNQFNHAEAKMFELKLAGQNNPGSANSSSSSNSTYNPGTYSSGRGQPSASYMLGRTVGRIIFLIICLIILKVGIAIVWKVISSPFR